MPHHPIPWVRLPPEEHVISDPAVPLRPQPPVPLPPDPRRQPKGSGNGWATPPVVSPAPPSGATDFGAVLLDGPLVSVFLVSPEYPLRAAAQGLEGHVTVEYDVTEAGTVANVVVIESSHKVFETAATEAAYRFRYKPKIVDGVAQATRGLRNRFVFRMED